MRKRYICWILKFHFWLPSDILYRKEKASLLHYFIFSKMSFFKNFVSITKRIFLLLIYITNTMIFYHLLDGMQLIKYYKIKIKNLRNYFFKNLIITQYPSTIFDKICKYNYKIWYSRYNDFACKSFNYTLYNPSSKNFYFTINIPKNIKYISNFNSRTIKTFLLYSTQNWNFFINVLT